MEKVVYIVFIEDLYEGDPFGLQEFTVWTSKDKARAHLAVVVDSYKNELPHLFTTDKNESTHLVLEESDDHFYFCKQNSRHMQRISIWIQEKEIDKV